MPDQQIVNLQAFASRLAANALTPTDVSLLTDGINSVLALYTDVGPMGTAGPNAAAAADWYAPLYAIALGVGGEAMPTVIPVVPVTAFPGVDPTGATDSGAGLQTAINTAAANGVILEWPDGTYLCDRALVVPNGAVWDGTPNAVIDFAYAVGNGFVGAIPANVGGATTLSATPAEGSQTLAVTAIVGIVAGGWIRVTSAASTIQQYYAVENAVGTTLTVDRPLMFPWASGDTVQAVGSAPPCVDVRGNGMQITGAFILGWTGAYWNSRVTGLRFSGMNGAGVDAAFVWNSGSYGCVDRALYVDGKGAASTYNAGVAIVGCEQCGHENFTSLNGNSTSTGCKLDDCRGCWASFGKVAGHQYGILLSTDFGVSTNTTQFARVIGNEIDNCATAGIALANASNNELVGNSTSYGGADGVNLSGTCVGNHLVNHQAVGNTGHSLNLGAGALGTVVEGFTSMACANYDLLLNAECWVSGLYIDSETATGPQVWVATATATTRFAIERFKILSVSPGGAVGAIHNDGGTLVLRDGEIDLGTNGDIGIWNSGATGTPTTSVENVIVQPHGGATGTVGVYAPAGTMNLLASVSLDATATPIQFGAGTVTLAQQGGCTSVTATATLSIAQSYAPEIELTTAAAANATITTPAVAGLGWRLYNPSAFTLTLEATGAATSVTVAAGKSAVVQVNAAGNMVRVSPDT